MKNRWLINAPTLMAWRVTNAATGADVGDATVTAELKDDAGGAVPGAGFLTGVFQSGNLYHITLPETLALTEGTFYTLHVTTVAPGIPTDMTKVRRRASTKNL